MITKSPHTLLLTHDENKLLNDGGFIYLTFRGKYGESIDLCKLVSYQFEEKPVSNYCSSRFVLSTKVGHLKETEFLTEQYKFNKNGLIKMGFDLKILKNQRNMLNIKK